MSEMQPNNKRNLVPTGAGLAAICFFLPWLKFSCSPDMKIKQTLSGYDLGREYWVVFIAAIVIFGAFFYFNRSSDLKKARLIAFWGSLLALAFILFKYFADYKSGIKTEFGVIDPADIGFTIEYGGYGILIGFIMAFFGSFHVDDQPIDDEHRGWP